MDREFQIGDIVKAVSAKYGWGNAKAYDTGKIVDIDSKHNVITLQMSSNGNMLIFDVNDIAVAEETRDIDIINMHINNELLRACRQIIAVDKVKLDEEVALLSNELRHLYEQVTKKEKTIAFTKTLSFSSNLKKTYVKRNKALLHSISSINGKYVDVKGNNYSLTARTSDIRFEDSAREGIICFGQYDITINFIDKSISIFNVDKERAEKIGFNHPNIPLSGTPCLGTYGRKITSAITKYDLGLALYYIYEFLSSKYDNGAYIRNFHWLTDMDKRCQSCGYFTEECQCKDEEDSDNACEYCGLSDCICTRCPVGGRRLHNSQFPDTDCIERCVSYANHTCELMEGASNVN